MYPTCYILQDTKVKKSKVTITKKVSSPAPKGKKGKEDDESDDDSDDDDDDDDDDDSDDEEEEVRYF